VELNNSKEIGSARSLPQLLKLFIADEERIGILLQ
jgi:hypothetical protein